MPTAEKAPSRIREVSPHYVEFLVERGYAPALPVHVVDALAISDAPTTINVREWRWLSAGSDDAVMAFRIESDHFGSGPSVYVGHIAGSKRGVLYLMIAAVRMAREHGATISGEIGVTNATMEGTLRFLGLRPERQVWSLPASLKGRVAWVAS